MAKIVLISGKAMAGKDATAMFLARYGWNRVAFADALKEIAGRLFGFDSTRAINEPGYKAQVRTTLIFFGKLCRSVDQDCWARQVHQKIVNSDLKRAVVPDWRFWQEGAVLESLGHQIITVRIEASESARRCRMGEAAWERYQATAVSDPSETALDGMIFQHTLNNDGPLSDLEETVALGHDELEKVHGYPRFPASGRLEGVLTPSYEWLERRVKELETLLANKGPESRP